MNTGVPFLKETGRSVTVLSKQSLKQTKKRKTKVPKELACETVFPSDLPLFVEQIAAFISQPKTAEAARGHLTSGRLFCVVPLSLFLCTKASTTHHRCGVSCLRCCLLVGQQRSAVQTQVLPTERRHQLPRVLRFPAFFPHTPPSCCVPFSETDTLFSCWWRRRTRAQVFARACAME